MTNDNSNLIAKFLNDTYTYTSVDEILSWVTEKNNTLKVNMRKCKLSECKTWFYDEAIGEIRNLNNSFFQIRGLREYDDEDKLIIEQPVLIQDEIGYLGIICKEINGVIHLLMQAKVEPGNVNKIQISPTIQATKSNFTQMHGGKKPAYLDYFLNADKHTILFDQIQSEQSSRFLGKRNRNIMILINEDVEVLPSHKWITLKQLKELMKTDNLVNMDTRTVLSCIPFSLFDIKNNELNKIKTLYKDETLFNSIYDKPDHNDFVKIYRYINDYKMLRARKAEIVPLKSLRNWTFSDNEIKCKDNFSFKVIYCEIEIEGREVTHWAQPLFEAVGMATFGLIMSEFDGKKKFLVHALPEAGCFDGIELAPTVQLEPSEEKSDYDPITLFFLKKMQQPSCMRNNVILSEEGGRFYQEQNKNIIIEVQKDEIPVLPQGYFWADYNTLNNMIQYNNTLNIQLRNLLSLLEI